jgi:hypothetical protein
MPPEGRICRTYAEMCDAINARLVELNVPHLEVDHRSGIASGLTGKLLAPRPMKGYGRITFDAHLQVLGLRIVVEVDPDRPPLVSDSRAFSARSTADVTASRLRTREGHQLLVEFLRENRRRNGKKLREGYMRLPAEKRSAIARTAALARWERKRPVL